MALSELRARDLLGYFPKTCRNGRVQGRFWRFGNGRIAARLAQPVRPVKATTLRIQRGRREQCWQSALCGGLKQEPQEAPPQAQDAGLARAVGQQLGARDARMRGDTGYAPARRFAAPLKLEGEHQAGQLGLTVDRHRLVAMFCLQIVEVDGSVPRSDAGEGDDARAAPLPQQRQKMGGERKMTEIVRAELQLESIAGRPALRRRHHAGIIDEHVEMIPLLAQAAAERRCCAA